MNRFSILIICACAFSVVAADRPQYHLKDAEKHFQEFMKTYGKKYEGVEYNNRLQAFKENLVEINKRNSDPDEMAEFGITKFSDLSQEEFKRVYLSRPPPSWAQNEQQHYPDPSEAIPNVEVKIVEDFVSVRDPKPLRFDARDYGLVTEVKDQGKCGSGYAFAALGVLESTYVQHKGHKLTSLSAQQIVDCSKDCNGCDGSNCTLFNVPSTSVRYEAEAAYPYEGKVGKCRYNINKTITYAYFVGKFRMLNEDTYRNIATGWDGDIHKFTVAIQIDATSLQHYKEGVIRKCSFDEYNHGVLLVGYNTYMGTIDYWTFKNSWGKDFGESGYFRVERNVNSCGMKTSRNLLLMAGKPYPPPITH